MKYIIVLFYLALVSCSETTVSKVEKKSKKEGPKSQKKYVDDPVEQGKENENVTQSIKKKQRVRV